eukprot:Gregarina_sp_Poly_1__9244@NODE_570_length_7488_cov_15_500606_g447_i0_p2_GENE_NODE_570_length_7488_cov_15_500606_g447_i0NODE_570_length_7488_cov_15_500606_g447_i0_p2_ORF_typecomplete_len139_score6_62_NODE_570_length_7488_cov_15_500606_g447_i069877403
MIRVSRLGKLEPFALSFAHIENLAPAKLLWPSLPNELMSQGGAQVARKTDQLQQQPLALSNSRNNSYTLCTGNRKILRHLQRLRLSIDSNIPEFSAINFFGNKRNTTLHTNAKLDANGAGCMDADTDLIAWVHQWITR